MNGHGEISLRPSVDQKWRKPRSGNLFSTGHILGSLYVEIPRRGNVAVFSGQSQIWSILIDDLFKRSLGTNQ